MVQSGFLVITAFERQISSSNFVKEEFTGPIDIIYKVEATYLSQDSDLKEVVENPSKKIDLKLDVIGKDVFGNQDQLKHFAHQFALGILLSFGFIKKT